MKTLNKGLYLLFAVLLVAGCMKEDTEDCPVDPEFGLVLLFEYYDKEGKDVFNERIEGIDVAIYDQYHNLYEWLNVDEVLQYQERKKTIEGIEPGTYYIVSWANDVSFRQNRMLLPEDPGLEHAYMYNSFSTTSADQLHYAPDLRQLDETEDPADNLSLYKVEVLPDAITYHTLSYMGAYHTVEVFLQGFDEVKSGIADHISISITHLSRYYDSFLHHEEENLNYNTNATNVVVDEEELGFASFYVPHFDNESLVTVEIDGNYSFGEPYHFTVTMNEVLEKLNLKVIDGECQTIKVLVELKGSYVVVSLPDWLVEDVEPGFNEKDE